MRLAFVGLALALAAISMLRVGETSSAAASADLTRLDLAGSMQQVLDELGLALPVASPSHRCASQSFSDVATEQRSFLEQLDQAALLRGFADRTFRPTLAIRWGEALYHWSRLLKWLEERGNVLAVATGPAVAAVAVPPRWAWLRADLERLFRLGVMDAALVSDLRPEAIADRNRWQGIVARTVQAWRSGNHAAVVAPPVDAASRSGAATSSPTPAGAAAPSAPSLAGPVLTIEVRDSIQRQPVVGAQVVANGRPLAPSADGRFRLPLPAPGAKLDLLFTAAGHASLRLRHIAGTRSDLSILLKPLRATLTVRVQSAADRQPLRGASVKLGDRQVTSDGRGQAVFRGLPPGYHAVEAVAPGFQPTRQLIYLEETGSTRSLRLQPQLGS
ncbi:MAG: hypothetical protein OZSIB_1195 [Candidatus Ozemobacter sibiricus]|uniref:Carboxypeptidase regulatory-like domain-containing protein n=1 Tax=Candidatus Ozemobacter sibiricus TaxID=2268124 RepID=A0A367ZKQ1_9BACT|nr:MAG: hypothetical protein OZSIB_1195 [Candidatus Ozemobacter sibiricus]